MYNFVECAMVSNSVDTSERYYDERKIETMNYLGTLSPAASSVDSADIKMHSPMSASMSPTQLIYSGNVGNMMLLDDVLPYLTVNEQPVEKFRFRYKSEMVGTHGSLNGINSDRIRKSTYPTVQLHGYDGPAVIRCSLYQIKKEEPHAHRLVVRAGNGEKDDPHDIPVSPERGYTAVFQGMGIIHTAKKHLVSELVKKKSRLYGEELARKGIFRKLTALEDADITRQAEAESKNINLNTVRLRFQAFKVEQNNVFIPLTQPVYSHGINNLKSALTGELKIVRMDVTTTSCVGGQEIFMLVEKVTKNNIKVRFFECDEEDNEIWHDYGRFSHIDVHHQYAIVFKAPPYRDINIENTVEVCIELVRPSDGARSEPRVFKYKPSDRVGRKRVRYSESLSSTELPTTINNVSFGSSVSFSDSMIFRDPDFLKKIDNVNTEEFDDLFREIAPEYQNCVGQPLRTDGPSYEISYQVRTYDNETEKMAKKVVGDLTTLLKQKPKPEAVERVVNNLFHELLTADGNNALHTSILCEQYQHLQYILVLLSKMKHLKIVDNKNNNGETALHLAVKINNAKVVDSLLTIGADPNLADCKGNTPLHFAIQENLNLDELKPLVRITELDTENDDAYTPLHLAVLKGNMQSVKILTESNANVNYKHRSNGNTSLHMAVEEKCLNIVQYLLENTNARLDDENFTKTTPLHLAKIFADCEGEISARIFDVFTNYIKDKGFESLVIKNEPEDEDTNSDIEALTIKSEPASPEMEMQMESESDSDPLKPLRRAEFSDECIKTLATILDGTPVIERLMRDLDFYSIGESLSNISTKIILNYANVTGVSVYDVREYLSSYKATNAVKVIDSMYLDQK